jgi:uncharacterized protein Usg
VYQVFYQAKLHKSDKPGLLQQISLAAIVLSNAIDVVPDRPDSNPELGVWKARFSGTIHSFSFLEHFLVIAS